MIDVEELITEPVLYSTVWHNPVSSHKHTLYITHNKIYLCDLYNGEYFYSFFPTSAIVRVFCNRDLTYDNSYKTVVSLGGDDRYNGIRYIEFTFPKTDEGKTMSEDVYVAISKAIG